MKKLINMKLIAMLAAIAILAVGSHENAATAGGPVPDSFSGYVYQGSGTSTPLEGAAVSAKNLSTQQIWNVTSQADGWYSVAVNANVGANFYIKATKTISGFGYEDDATVYHPGNNSNVNHDFHLTHAD